MARTAKRGVARRPPEPDDRAPGPDQPDQAEPEDRADLADVLANWDATLDAAEWVTLPEAAAAAGVSISALRTWYRRDEVASQLAAGPHGQQRLVRLEDVLVRAARSRRAVTPGPADAGPAAAGPGAGGGDGPEPAGAVMHILATQLQRTEDRADRAEAALRDAIARAAAAEAERDLLRRLLDERG